MRITVLFILCLQKLMWCGSLIFCLGVHPLLLLLFCFAIVNNQRAIIVNSTTEILHHSPLNCFPYFSCPLSFAEH